MIKQMVILIALAVELLAEVVPYSGKLEISYESIMLPGDESLGLLRTAALFDINRYLYGGVAMYSALKGRRGGFFTVGAEGGIRYPFTQDFGLKSGLFLGAGGGGAAPQGGGLMVRPYAEVTYEVGEYTLGIGASHVRFPNGKISSSQFYGSLSIPMGGDYWYGHDPARTPAEGSHPPETSRRYSASVLIEKYRPLPGVHNANSTVLTTPFSLAGVEFLLEDETPWYTFYQAAGAGGGNANGYMEVFGGVGYRYDPAHLLSLKVQGAVGAAGGGKVDTGGGLMYRVDGEVDLHPFDRVSLGFRAGRIGSAGGSFAAWSYGGTLAYTERFYGLGGASVARDDAFGLSMWRFRLLHKSYLPFDNMFKDTRRNRVDLLGFALDRFLTENLYVSGLSYWAYKGKAGGYAEGVFGLGYESDRYRGLGVYGEVQVGVGGGGGLNMGGGFFGAAEGGLVYDLNDAWQLRLGGGYIRSKGGSFATRHIRFDVGYNFSLMGE